MFRVVLVLTAQSIEGERAMSFSLRWLFIAILAIALCIVALLNANPYWAGAARTTVILLLPLAASFAVMASGTRRAFWLGFAICGTAQFAAMGFADADDKSANEADYKPLITDRAIDWLHAKVIRDVETEVQIYKGGLPFGTESRTVQRPLLSHFLVVGRCVWPVAIGLLGGSIVAWFYSRRESPKGNGQ